MNQEIANMTRWKKDETVFTVSLSFDGNNSKSCRIPKPILELLSNPDEITFEIKRNGRLIIQN